MAVRPSGREGARIEGESRTSPQLPAGEHGTDWTWTGKESAWRCLGGAGREQPPPRRGNPQASTETAAAAQGNPVENPGSSGASQVRRGRAWS